MCDCVLEAIGPKGHSFEAFTTSIVHMFMISKLKFYERSHWHCFPSYIGNHGVSPMFLFEGGRDHEQRLSLSFVAQTIQSIGLPIESNRVEQTPSVWWEWTRVFASLSPCELPPLECKKKEFSFGRFQFVSSLGGWDLLPFKGCQIARREARLCTHHSSASMYTAQRSFGSLNNRPDSQDSNIHWFTHDLKRRCHELRESLRQWAW